VSYGDRRDRPTASVALVDPKFSDNVARVLRTCAAFDVRELWVTGRRSRDGGKRVPRELRYSGYRSVKLREDDGFLSRQSAHVVPVAVELLPGAEQLTYFSHPASALYVFGPEDGGLSSEVLSECHRFLVVPSDHCLNLSVAVAIVLAHRRMQRQLTGQDSPWQSPS
jgi:tRNA(Leu) C34 or U34 (ribose-2'-O)-methylase TrmL